MLYNWNLYNIAHQLYFNLKHKTKSTSSWDFPGGYDSVVPVQGGVGPIPGWGTKIPHVAWPKKEKLHPLDIFYTYGLLCLNYVPI